MATPEQTAAVKAFIKGQWPATVRRSDGSVENELPLPKPFTVPTPGAAFRTFFYWDTYYTSIGLVRQGLVEQARDNADCMLHLIRELGYVPNFTLRGHLNRSQPPHAALQVWEVYSRTRDKAWLAEAYPLLKKEHAFWMAMRATGTGLNRYGTHGDPQAVEQFYWVIKDRFKRIPEDPRARMPFLYHAMAEAESGWDFTPRFDRRCADFAPVDLNALMHLHERTCAQIADELALAGEGDSWRRAADDRQRRFSEVAWDASAGLFFDADLANRRRSLVVSAANAWALWSKLCSKDQAERIIANLPLLERDHGITTCKPGPRDERYQWDHPNAWPPVQYAMIQGLLAWGYGKDAARIAAKYVDTVVRNHEATGQLWEKYNAETGGVDVSDEYPMPPMQGWTAGVFLYAAEVVETASRGTGMFRR